MGDKRSANHFYTKPIHDFKKPRLNCVLQQTTKQNGPGTSKSFSSTKDKKNTIRKF